MTITKKKVIVATAIIVGSVYLMRKIKAGITRILSTKEPEEKESLAKAKFAAGDCCEARNQYVGRRHADCDCEALGDCCEAMSPCKDAAPMGKSRLVD